MLNSWGAYVGLGKSFLLDNVSQIAISATCNVLITRRTVVYLLPCYNFSHSEHVEAIWTCHINSVLFIALVVHVYCDIWPANIYWEPSRWIRRLITLGKTRCFIHNCRNYTTRFPESAEPWADDIHSFPDHVFSNIIYGYNSRLKNRRKTVPQRFNRLRQLLLLKLSPSTEVRLLKAVILSQLPRQVWQRAKANADSSGTKSAASKDEKKEVKKRDSDNLTGRINTLVTVDKLDFWSLACT